MEFRTKKSLGQNFLKDERLLKPIIDAAELSKDDTVLEIGPGFGILTEALARQVKLVVAVEKDYELVERLREKFHNWRNVKIIHDNALNFKFETLNPAYKIVANLPFNITSPVIRKIIEGPRPKLAVLTVQKEVATRLTSPVGSSERGIVTVFLERYAVVERVATIPRGAFSPVPAVDAAVIKIVPNAEPVDPLFDRVVKAGFSAKRRQIHNSLANTLRLPANQVVELLKKSNIDPKLRAEDLTLEQWKILATSVQKLLRLPQKS